MQTPVLVQVHRDRVVLQSTETQLRLRVIVERQGLDAVSTEERGRDTMQTPVLVQVHRDRAVLQSTKTHVRLRITLETMFRCNISHGGTSQKHYVDNRTGSGTS